MCFPSHGWSTRDVAVGYSSALRRVPGLEVRDWHLWPRIVFWDHASRAWGAKLRRDSRRMGIATKPSDHRMDRWGVLLKASLDLVDEALHWDADWVIIVCGIGFHPDALVMLQRARRNVASVFTECPYADRLANDFAKVSTIVGVNDRASVARVPRSFYLPTGWNADIHKPGIPADPELASDVAFIGTGFPERQRLLDAVDWSGIDFRIGGHWRWKGVKSLPAYPQGIPAGGRPSIWWTHLDGSAEHMVENEDAARWYRSAKVNLNLYRRDRKAESMSPRAYELAALGTFSLHEDSRAEAHDVLGSSVGYFRAGDPTSLEFAVRESLKLPHWERDRMAREAQERAQGHSYDDRLATLLREMERVTAPRLVAVPGLAGVS